MWKSFALELHGEWSEFADECIGMLLPVENRIGKRRPTFGYLSDLGECLGERMHSLRDAGRIIRSLRRIIDHQSSNSERRLDPVSNGAACRTAQRRKPRQDLRAPERHRL